MTAPPTGVLLAPSLRCCKVARLLGVLFCEDYPTRVGGRRYSDHMLLRFCNRKKLLFVFFNCFVLLVDSFFLFPGFPIYIPIYIVYIKFLLSLVTLICSYDLYYISLSMS